MIYDRPIPACAADQPCEFCGQTGTVEVQGIAVCPDCGEKMLKWRDNPLKTFRPSVRGWDETDTAFAKKAAANGWAVTELKDNKTMEPSTEVTFTIVDEIGIVRATGTAPDIDTLVEAMKDYEKSRGKHSGKLDGIGFAVPEEGSNAE